MDYFPLFLDIRGKRILVVGGGIIAFRKIKLILAAGGKPAVVAPDITPELQQLLDKEKLPVHQRKFVADDIKDATLIFVAVDDSQLQQEINSLASAHNIPVNVVDNQPLCSFITPAIVDRDPLLVAISSGGKSPVAARRLREDLEARLPTHHGKMAEFMSELRNAVKAKLPEERRRHFYEELWDSSAADLLHQGKKDKALQVAQQIMDGLSTAGMVWLAGAGPGSADTLTLRTLRLMHSADIIMHDRLVSNEVLQMARRDATVVPVGKPDTTQLQINQMMVKFAKQGKKVLRLKGGDPAIFGRLAEEMEYLRSHAVTFHISPGLTAALDCAAYANVPLTSRTAACGVVFLSLQSMKSSTTNTHKLAPYIVQILRDNARDDRTLVIYMGVENIALGVAELLDAGMDKQMPAIVIEKSGFPEQNILRTELKSLTQEMQLSHITSPAIIIIGRVVSE